MAPTVSTLPTSHEHEQLLKGEKKICFLVIPLSIFISCLIACIVYVVRRYRLKKAEQQSVLESVPVEVHHQAWLEQIRKINRQDSQTLFMTDETGKSPNSIRVRDVNTQLRNQSTPPIPASYCRRQRSHSPLRRVCHHPEEVRKNRAFESSLSKDMI